MVWTCCVHETGATDRLTVLVPGGQQLHLELRHLDVEDAQHSGLHMNIRLGAQQ